MRKQIAKPMIILLGSILIVGAILSFKPVSMSAYADGTRQECKINPQHDCKSSETHVIYCGYKLETVNTEVE